MQISEFIKQAINDPRNSKRPQYSHMGICYDLYAAIHSGKLSYDNANFCVIDSRAETDRVLKLAALMPSTVTLTHLNSVVTQIDHHICYDPEYPYPAGMPQLSECEVLCHLPPEGFFQACPELFTQGIVQYYPNICHYFIHPNGVEEMSRVATIQAGGGTVDQPGSPIDSKVFNAALELEIPYLYDTPIGEFSKIALDHTDALNNFRAFFGKAITEIDWSKPSERMDLQYQLRKGVNDLSMSYQKECLKLKKSLAIGTLTTVLMSVFVFSDLNTLMQCISGLSGGAGIISLFSSIYDFQIETASINGSDCYFLWLLGDKS